MYLMFWSHMVTKCGVIISENWFLLVSCDSPVPSFPIFKYVDDGTETCTHPQHSHFTLAFLSLNECGTCVKKCFRLIVGSLFFFSSSLSRDIFSTRTSECIPSLSTLSSKNKMDQIQVAYINMTIQLTVYLRPLSRFCRFSCQIVSPIIWFINLVIIKFIFKKKKIAQMY